MTAIRAGQLNRRLRIQARSSTQDSFGEPQFIWADIAVVWADIQPLGGRELESAQRTVSDVTHQILVRYQTMFADTRVVAGYRAIYNGRVFSLHASMVEEERNVIVTLLASEGVSDV
jgi:SPP1 family predicted phage head-tail adaptor